MNEGLKAAVIEAIRIFASVLVFFLLGFFRFYHGRVAGACAARWGN